MKNGTVSAPTLYVTVSLFLSHTHADTHTSLESCWGSKARVLLPSLPHLAGCCPPFFCLLQFFSPTKSDPAPLLSVTRVISLCYFIWLSNESNPSAFHSSAAQIMSAGLHCLLLLLLSHTSPPSPHPLPPNPAVNGWREANVWLCVCVSVHGYVNRAILPSPLCLFFPLLGL